MKNNNKVRKMWDKLMGSKPSSYKPMGGDSEEGLEQTRDVKNKSQPPNDLRSQCDRAKPPNKEVKKEKKKRKGWKRIRHAALITCRYIGMGVSHMSPISTYPVPDYNVDPVWWCNSVQGKHTPAPHWTTGIILNNW